MPSEPYTHIRVRVSTAARMRAAAEKIVRDVENSAREDPGVDPEPKNPAACGLSMDALINLLLDMPEATRRRAREQRARARESRQALPCPGEPTTP